MVARAVKKSVVAYFQVQFRQFPGKNGGNNEKPVRVIGLRSATGTTALPKMRQEYQSVVTWGSKTFYLNRPTFLQHEQPFGKRNDHSLEITLSHGKHCIQLKPRYAMTSTAVPSTRSFENIWQTVTITTKHNTTQNSYPFFPGSTFQFEPRLQKEQIP